MDVGADTSWTVVGTVALVCAFVGLFVLDVYRTRKNPDAPMRMLSEIAFNFAMNASISASNAAVCDCACLLLCHREKQLQQSPLACDFCSIELWVRNDRRGEWRCMWC